jgi:hypothetical protein
MSTKKTNSIGSVDPRVVQRVIEKRAQEIFADQIEIEAVRLVKKELRTYKDEMTKMITAAIQKQLKTLPDLFEKEDLQKSVFGKIKIHVVIDDPDCYDGSARIMSIDLNKLSRKKK